MELLVHRARHLVQPGCQRFRGIRRACAYVASHQLRNPTCGMGNDNEMKADPFLIEIVSTSFSPEGTEIDSKYTCSLFESSSCGKHLLNVLLFELFQTDIRRCERETAGSPPGCKPGQSESGGLACGK